MKKKHFCTQLWFGGSTKCDPINNTQWESHAAAWGQNILRYILTFLKNLQLHIYRVFFLALPFHPNFSAKKNVVQPTMIFCTSEISWNRISDRLPIVFHVCVTSSLDGYHIQRFKLACQYSEEHLSKRSFVVFFFVIWAELIAVSILVSCLSNLPSLFRAGFHVCLSVVWCR